MEIVILNVSENHRIAFEKLELSTGTEYLD
jgi:hypothetical protein